MLKLVFVTVVSNSRPWHEVHANCQHVFLIIPYEISTVTLLTKIFITPQSLRYFASLCTCNIFSNVMQRELMQRAFLCNLSSRTNLPHITLSTNQLGNNSDVHIWGLSVKVLCSRIVSSPFRII